MVADGVNVGPEPLRLAYPAILSQVGNYSNKGFLPQILHDVGTEHPGTQLDPQKLLKIRDKVLFGRGVPRPQPLYVLLVKIEEIHATLRFLRQEYIFAHLRTQWNNRFNRFISIVLKRNGPQTHYSFVGTPVRSGVLIRGEPSPVPMCPSGRIPARPERARMRLPSPKGGPNTMEVLWQVQRVTQTRLVVPLIHS
jgi:hypothetical protein